MGTRGGAVATTNATSTAAVSEKASERPKIRVLYDFEYEARGKPIKIVKDERLMLVQRTNKDWWQVIRPEDTEGFYVPEQNTFYVPTGYVKEEEPLPDSTRFYVDKDKMFKPTVEGTSNNSQPQHSNQDKNNHQATGQQDNAGNKEESKKGHDSFRSVIRKLSGNLGSVNDKDNKAAKATKPSKLIKLRKNSTDSSSDDVKLPTGKSSVVPSKHKESWESSAFGMCFGRDMKNVDTQALNPFQEELENALSNRVSMRRTTILDTKLGVNKQADQVMEEKENSKVQSKFENIHDRWEKASSQVLKKTDNNFQFVPLSKIKEDAQKRRSASPNFKIETSNTVNSGAKRLSEIEKLYSKVEKVESKLEKVDKTEKVEKVETVEKIDKAEKIEKVVENIEILEKNPKKPVQIPEQIVETVSKPADPEPPAPINTKIVIQSNNNINDNNNSSNSPSKMDIDRLLINDKRKMWAIETLMSELMQSSSQSKTVASTDNSDAVVAGPTQLAQELHDMNASRRYENAEIQVNLLDSKENDDVDDKDVNTKEKVQESVNTKFKVESWKKKKKVFDFPPPPQHSSMIKAAPKSPTARSPKLLDEYNEANILNDNERSTSSSSSSGNKRDNNVHAAEVPVSSYNESPSYSNISLRIKREKVPCKLKMPTKDFRDELQLTPSLEKLASEIKFLPASASSTDAEIDKLSLDLDCPTTTLSQDSLRLYKRRSKSDGALNKRDPRRRDSVNSSSEQSPTTSASHMDIFKSKEQQQQHHHQYHQQHHIERKYTQHEAQQQQSLSSSSYRNSCCMSKRDAVAASSTATSTQQQLEYYYRPERQQTARYNKLNRKSRSLGDLDCSELDEKKEDEEETSSTCEVESRRRYKPVPKLRSKESLRRMKPSPIIVTKTASVERLLAKPVPAKRRVQPSPPYHHQQAYDSSFDSLSEIDIERSTAVGFKSLLRTSESGSEEYLQYKTFPATTKTQQLQQQHQQQQHLSPYEQAKLSMSRSDGNVNLSRSLSDEAILSSTSCSSASPSRILDGSVENLVELPPGWTQSYDNIAKRVCFINDRGDKWFSSNDSEGKIYFFEENSNQSSWALPPVITESRVRTISNSDWPQLFDGNMCILKEGLINKTKITSENGKKLRKAWSTSYAVLTELFLLFFKDEKTFAAMKMDPSVAAKPDITVDLNGAFIESADKLSNRKNVYLINTLLGLQVLIQWENSSVIAEWYRGIHDAIQRLPISQEYGRSSSSRE